MKVKGEGKNCELAECAMRGRVSAEAHLHTRENGKGNTTEGGEEDSRREEEKTGEENRKKAGMLLEKDGRKEGKEDEFRKKVHKFSFLRRLIPKKTKLFLAKTMGIQNKKFTFALDKTQLSLFLPHCGVHIARNHGATRTNRRKRSLTY